MLNIQLENHLHWTSKLQNKEGERVNVNRPFPRIAAAVSKQGEKEHGELW